MNNKPHIRFVDGKWICGSRHVFIAGNHIFIPPEDSAFGFSKAGPGIAYVSWQLDCENKAEKQSVDFLKQNGPVSHISDDSSAGMDKAQISNRFVKSCGWLLLLFFPIVIVLYWFAGGQF